MGRKKLPEDERRVPVKVFLRPASYDLFRAHAEGKGLDFSKWAGDAMGQAYERERADRGRAVP